jgi:hypothetical protein
VARLVAGAIVVMSTPANAATIELGDGRASYTASAAASCFRTPPASESKEDEATTRNYSVDETVQATATNAPDDCGAAQTNLPRSRTRVVQDSRLFVSPAGLRLTAHGGTTSSTGGCFEKQNHFGDTAYQRTFTVTGGPVPYRVQGTIGAMPSNTFRSVFTSVQLTGGPGGFVQTVSAPGDICTTDGQVVQTVNQSGTLQPGTYDFDVSALCRGNGSSSNPAGGDACGASFDLQFEVGDAAPDTDGDGLLDTWETDGVDFTGDGSIELELPAMGADPRHKDVFIEIDSISGHALSQAALDRMTAAFAAAPVANPDGVSGVTLHVDNGPGSTMNPRSGQTWGALSDADTLPHDAVLGTFLPNGQYDWTAFDLIKAGNFSIHREPVFHYVVSGHRFGSATNNASGISRGIGASDLIVSLGGASEPGEGSGTVDEQAGTLMHELGHNLGLEHGGDDGKNYKPSYLSIMNYSFQFSGLIRADGTTELDYSRVGASLDEGNLDESSGFGFGAGTPPADYLSLIRCPNDPVAPLIAVELLAGPIDWDCNGTVQGVVARDLNLDATIGVFTPFLDWPALVYTGGSIGALGGGIALPQTTEMIEPDLQELLANQRVMETAAAKRRAAVQPGSSSQPGATADKTAPAFAGRARANPSTFAVDTKGKPETSLRRAARAARKGTTFLYGLSEDARVVFSVERGSPGRRAGARCVGQTRANRKRKRCTRYVRAGAFAHAGQAGNNRKSFSGRIGRKRLAPGNYRVTLVATDAAGNRSAPHSFAFRVVRR